MSACSVWWARPSDVRPEHDALLTPGELRRRDRFRRPGDRRRATASAAVLRLVLGAVLDRAPQTLPVDRGCPTCGRPHGRPRVAGGPEVTVAHTADCLVVAVHADRPVGVDVEEVGRFPPGDLARLAEVVLAPGERRGRLSAAGLATTWTRKEAVLKATGVGLAGLDGVAVSAPGARPRVLAGDAGPVRLVDLRPPAGLVGALAVLGEAPVRLVEHDAGPLLREAARLR